jgi:hypothetical protein
MLCIGNVLMLTGIRLSKLMPIRIPPQVLHMLGQPEKY